MRALIEFLKQLHDNNDREWFHAHQKEWKHAQSEFYAVVGQLLEGVEAFDPSVRGLQVKDCVYRIARDTRFSKDKSPYKNWLGAYFAPRGKKSGYAGYYFHVEPKGDGLTGGSMLSAGLYCSEPFVLRSVREEILDHGAEIVRAIDASGFELYRGNSLKRTPVGFPAGTEHDDLLRQKDHFVQKFVSEEFLLDPKLVEKTLAEFRRTQPFIAMLNRAVEYAYEQAGS